MLLRHGPRLLPILLSVVSLVAAAPVAASDAPVPRLFNAVPSVDYPAVGMMTYPGVECTVTLIGCRTVLTAAHCACFDFSTGQPRLLQGDACRARPDLLDPANKRVFFQHAGVFGVEEVVLHPLWGAPGESGHDVAILRLDRPVEGVLPAAINRDAPPAPGTEVTLVGFGRTGRDREDQAIKRTGRAVVDPECSPSLFCSTIDEPLAPAGEETGFCFNDSGGPVLADLGAGPVVAGVAYGISNGTCGLPNTSRATEITQERQWIEDAAGLDFGTRACGSLPPLEHHPDARYDGSGGRLSEEEPEAAFVVDVLPETELLRLALNTEGLVEPATNDFDLFAAPGTDALPGPGSPCASRSPEGVEFCELRSPSPGPWRVRVLRDRGAGEFQLVASQFALTAEPPEPPSGGWLAAPELPGYEVLVRFGDAAERHGELVDDCIAEAICVSGALPDRPELFVKVIGPRPNGHFWVQVSRFTPARAEIWIRRTETGTLRHYVLDPVGPASDDVPGLQDRQAFPAG